MENLDVFDPADWAPDPTAMAQEKIRQAVQESKIAESLRLGGEGCDCRGCSPTMTYAKVGNPPHGWFRLARGAMATHEDRYVWCCLYCHTLVFDRGGSWYHLNLHPGTCAARAGHS